MSVISPYPPVITCQLFSFFTFSLSSPFGNYSIIDPNFQRYNGFISSSTGQLTFDKPSFLNPTGHVFTILNGTTSFTFTLQVVDSLDNVFEKTIDAQQPNIEITYNAPASLPYLNTYALYQYDTTGGKYSPPLFSTSLPFGLLLNTTTGIINGYLTYNSLKPFTAYQMRVRYCYKSNGVTTILGNSYTYFYISISQIPVFNYPNSPYLTLEVNKDIPPIIPNISSGSQSLFFQIDVNSPTLPDGLLLNKSNGTIHGQPTPYAIITPTTFTITAIPANSNSANVSGSATVILAINQNPQTSLFAYNGTPFTITQGNSCKFEPTTYLDPNATLASQLSTPWILLKPTILPDLTYADNYISYYNDSTIIGVLPVLYNYPYMETWLYNGLTAIWSRISTDLTSTPSGRHGAALACNTLEGNVYMFGGLLLETDVSTNELWKFNINNQTWTRINSFNNTSPPYVGNRVGSLMVYDSDRNNLILYGGYQFTVTNYLPIYDTWIYSCTNNTWLVLSPPLNPYVYKASMVYASVEQKVILYGGRKKDYLGLEYEVHDTWKFDPVLNTWTEYIIDPMYQPYPSDSTVAMTYDEVSNRAYIMGGSPNTPQSSGLRIWLFYFDCVAETWTGPVSILNYPPLGLPHLYSSPAMTILKDQTLLWLATNGSTWTFNVS